MPLIYNSAAVLLSTYSRKMKLIFRQTPAHRCHGSPIRNCPKLEITQVSFNGWVAKQTMVHPHSGVLLSIKKEQTIDQQNNFDKSPENYAKKANYKR